MIRRSLKSAREAIFCVELPDQSRHGMLMPTGTGFFTSPDGWFVTAAHVITKDGTQLGDKRDDVSDAWLMNDLQAMCQFITLEYILPEFDFALLRVDFNKNSNKEWLKNRSDFPYIQISTRQLEIGELVYSFGYPLSTGESEKIGRMIIGTVQLSPRLTSAVVSSNLDKTDMIMTDLDPKHYVLDKALNYGNSGGPILATETGKVHALCSRFQPVYVPQEHLKDPSGRVPYIKMPSLYSVVSSLNNKPIIELLKKVGVPISED